MWMLLLLYFFVPERGPGELGTDERYHYVRNLSASECAAMLSEYEYLQNHSPDRDQPKGWDRHWDLIGGQCDLADENPVS